MQFLFNEQDLIDVIALRTAQNYSDEFGRQAYVQDAVSKISHSFNRFRAEGSIRGHHYQYNQQEFADAIAYYVGVKFNVDAALNIDFHEQHGDYSAVATII